MPRAGVEDRVGLPHGVLTSFFAELIDENYLRLDGDELQLAPRGEQVSSALVLSWRDYLRDQLREWLPDETVESPETDAVMYRVVTRVIRESTAPGRHSLQAAAASTELDRARG